jgi:lipoprotein-anchoring transpeptidase ErfK/SrfK
MTREAAMKLNGLTGMLALFIGVVIAAAALLLQEDSARSQAPASAHALAVAAKAAPATPAARPAAAAPAKPADERFVIKRILPISGPIKYGEWHWDEAGAPATGPIVVTVDLDARVISVFRAGYEIGAAAVLLGTQEKPTPTGVFPILWKKRDHYSSIYNRAPMPFTQRLTNDGVSIHGTTVERGYASHGCIGTPNPFAKKVFAATKLGDKVYITRGKRVGMGDSLI